MPDVAHRERPRDPEAGRRGEGECAELKRRVPADGTDPGPDQGGHRDQAERQSRGHDLILPGATMGTWIIWLIVAAVLGVAEIMTATLAFGLIAVAALVGAGVGAVGGSPALQFGAFPPAPAAGPGIPRPFAIRPTTPRHPLP